MEGFRALLTGLGSARARTHFVSYRSAHMSNRKHRMPAELLPSLEALEARLLLSGQPMISEFLASNVTGIVDYQNAHDDWIEICNPSSQALDLTGWKLREGKSSSSYTEWSFPAVTLGPGEFRIVFASGKDLRNPAGELHTNFSIKKSGEYLGLADPGGNVVQEFNPFPQQYDDMSYGVGQNIDEIKLVSAGATAKYLVPTSGALGTTWTTTGFTDTAWASGPTGLGFTNLTGGFSVWRYQGNIPQATLATAQSVIDTPANRASEPDADFSRWVTPEQIARVIRFLCSDDSAPISGAHIPVYGRA